MKDHIELFTDGAASGNPGPGGYGIVLKYSHHRKEMSGGFRLTTNNRMELMAVIKGLELIKDKALNVKIYSDSKYIVDAVNEGWLYNWKKNRFNKKANADLWLQFLKIYDAKRHEFIWVKGHSEHKENNRCDVLAVIASKKKDLPPDVAYENLRNEGMFED